MYDTSESDEEEGATDLFGGSGGMGEAASLALLVSLTLCFVLLVVFVTIMYLRFKKREDKEKKSKQRYHRTAMSDPDVGALFGSGGLGSGFGNTLSELIEQSSGSGSGLPLLVQRTIAKQVIKQAHAVLSYIRIFRLDFKSFFGQIKNIKNLKSWCYLYK